MNKVLCLFAGLCSGLTVGYLSIDSLTLELKLKNGTEEEVRAVTITLLISLLFRFLGEGDFTLS